MQIKLQFLGAAGIVVVWYAAPALGPSAVAAARAAYEAAVSIDPVLAGGR